MGLIMTEGYTLALENLIWLENREMYYRLTKNMEMVKYIQQRIKREKDWIEYTFEVKL